jgi:hypothetical protein
MSHTIIGGSSESEQTISNEAAIEILRNQRRRFTLHYLKQVDEPVPVTELAERVGEWETGQAAEKLNKTEHKRVYTALQQFHLPKMAEYGFVEFDHDKGQVSLSTAAANTEFYVDPISGRDVPWSTYYLGLSILTVIGWLAVWSTAGPFAAVSMYIYGIFIATMMVMLSLGHSYDTYYRMRLGAGGDPPRVEER